MRIAIAVFVGAIAGGVLGVWWQANRTRSSTSRPEWLMIKRYDGPISPDEHVLAHVYVARRFSGRGSETKTFLQNKIDVQLRGQSSVFEWPDSESYAAGWAEVADLNHDGFREFMLGDDRAARVVYFRDGRFMFRPEKDEVFSVGVDIGPRDLDSDGRLEFIVGQPIAISPAQDGAFVQRIKRWTTESGFVDVSHEFQRYYQQLIPELEHQMQAESRPQLRQAYEEALREAVDLARTPADAQRGNRGGKQ